MNLRILLPHWKDLEIIIIPRVITPCTLPSTQRSQGFLKKWLSSDLGLTVFQMILEYFIQPENEVVRDF